MGTSLHSARGGRPRGGWRMAGHSPLWPGCTCQGPAGPARGTEATGAKAGDAVGRGPRDMQAPQQQACQGRVGATALGSALSQAPPPAHWAQRSPRGGQRVCRACGRQVQRARCRPGSRVLTVTVTTRWALASASPPVKMGETQPPTRPPGGSRKWKDRAARPAGPRQRGSPTSSRPCPTPSLQAVTPALTVGMVAEGPGVPRWPGGSPFSPTLPPGICSTPTA